MSFLLLLFLKTQFYKFNKTNGPLMLWLLYCSLFLTCSPTKRPPNMITLVIFIHSRIHLCNFWTCVDCFTSFLFFSQINIIFFFFGTRTEKGPKYPQFNQTGLPKKVFPKTCVNFFFFNNFCIRCDMSQSAVICRQRVRGQREEVPRDRGHLLVRLSRPLSTIFCCRQRRRGSRVWKREEEGQDFFKVEF